MGALEATGSIYSNGAERRWWMWAHVWKVEAGHDRSHKSNDNNNNDSYIDYNSHNYSNDIDDSKGVIIMPSLLKSQCFFLLDSFLNSYNKTFGWTNFLLSTLRTIDHSTILRSQISLCLHLQAKLFPKEIFLFD